SQLFVRKLRWAPGKLIRVGSLVAATGSLISAAAWAVPARGVGYLITAAGMGFVLPALPALARRAVEAPDQRPAAGAGGADEGLGIVIGPLAATAIYAISPSAPYLVASLALIVVALWRTSNAASLSGDNSQ